MNGTLTIGKFFNIPLKLHWSFALLMAYVLFNVIANHSLAILGYVVFLFLCVVLHEYGHALMALRYRVKTKDIILSPIGGVARLEHLPEKPAQELLIALAGPAVNLGLAIILSAILYFSGFQWTISESPEVYQAGLEDYLLVGLYINLLLFGFNLIPAFPMDGGRVLRSLLAIWYGRSKATSIAGWIGRTIAFIFILYGLYNRDYMFALLGLFIFMMARVEMNEVVLLEKLSSFTVASFCRIQIPSYHLGDSMSVAIERAMREGQLYSVVYDSLGYVAGLLTPAQIVAAGASAKEDDTVSVWMEKDLHYIKLSDTLKTAYEYMQKHQLGVLLVQDDNDKTVSVIDKDAINRAIGLFS